jgi:hypothetical protein
MKEGLEKKQEKIWKTTADALSLYLKINQKWIINEKM